MILWKTTNLATDAQTTLTGVSVLKVKLEADLQCSQLEHEYHENFPHWSHLKFPELI